MPKQVYMPNETVNVRLTFTNKDTAAGVINPFPPAINIRAVALGNTIVWSRSAGNETARLEPGETRTYDFTWDQSRSDGGQAVVGWYEIEVYATGLKVPYSGKPRGLSTGRGSFLIQYPQGVMQKTIVVNETKTVRGLHLKWVRVDGSVGYDYVIDVAITLQRIELTELGTKFYALVVSPNNPLSRDKYFNPWFGQLPHADYTVDGTPKDAGNASGDFPDDGARLVWGRTVTIDPVPNGAKELNFTISQYGEWTGPWEFHVSLQ